MSLWREAYVIYRQLEPRWLEFYRRYPIVKLETLQDFVRRGWENVAPLLVPALPRPGGGLRDGIIEINRLLERAGDRHLGHPLGTDEPLDDVYHAAFYVMFHRYPWQTKDTAFRGQRQMWRVQPSLFVPPALGTPLNAEEFDRRVRRLARYVAELGGTAGLADNIATVEERIAAAQHHGIPTWLVDVSSDPFVALFFASHHGSAGQLGVMMRFCTNEWLELNAGSGSRVGMMRVVAAPHVRRLQAQKGFFLENSHPDIVEQYVAYRLVFRQQPGLVFEDAGRGITEAALLGSTDDPLTEFTDRFRRQEQLGAGPAETLPALPGQPDARAMEPLTAADYRTVALSWLHAPPLSVPADSPLPANVDRILDQLCEFHHRLQLRPGELSIVPRSLRRLKSATTLLVLHLPPSDRPALTLRGLVDHGYLGHALGEEKAVILAVCDEVDP